MLRALHIKEEIRWEFSLVLWIFFAAFMWVVIRFLNEYFLVFQQVFLRASLSVVLSFLLYYIFFWKSDFSNIKKKDWTIIFLRAIFHLSAVALWILALLNTSLANATLVWSVPATAILWIIFFGDRLWRTSFVYLLLSIIWAIIISYEGDLQIWIGELYAFTASFLFSSYSLLRKKLSNNIWDREVSLVSLSTTSLLSFIVLLLLQPDFSRFFENYSPMSLIYVLIWALVFLCISFFWIYGFKRVSPLRASSIEFLEIPFAIILGFIFFWEYVNFKDAIWWCCIVSWAYLLMKSTKNNI